MCTTTTTTTDETLRDYDCDFWTCCRKDCFGIIRVAHCNECGHLKCARCIKLRQEPHWVNVRERWAFRKERGRMDGFYGLLYACEFARASEMGSLFVWGVIVWWRRGACNWVDWVFGIWMRWKVEEWRWASTLRHRTIRVLHWAARLILFMLVWWIGVT